MYLKKLFRMEQARDRRGERRVMQIVMTDSCQDRRHPVFRLPSFLVLLPSFCASRSRYRRGGITSVKFRGISLNGSSRISVGNRVESVDVRITAAPARRKFDGRILYNVFSFSQISASTSTRRYRKALSS